MFQKYKAAQGIDALHQVILEARARKAGGEAPGKDAYIQGLEPRAAVRARVIPVLQTEKERLEAVLAEVSSMLLAFA